MSSDGRFVWYELMTSDVEAAKAFYTEAIGWKTQEFEGADYTMFAVGDRPIGGLMLLPEEAKKMGAPPHWLGHLGVADCDASAKKAVELGGKILRPPEDIEPGVGRFAVVADPQGAVLSLFQSKKKDQPEPPKLGNGDISWNELNTTDYEAAWKYYSELAGWEHSETHDMGEEMGKYFMYKQGGTDRTLGGMSNAAKMMNVPPHWLYYITVDDLDAAIARVTSNGGKVMNGPMDVPGGDRIAQCADPQGCAFALHSGKK